MLVAEMGFGDTASVYLKAMALAAGWRAKETEGNCLDYVTPKPENPVP